MLEGKKRERIFELLKEIRENHYCNAPFGLLIVFSDIHNVLARGAFPIAKTSMNKVNKVSLKEKYFESICNINSDKAIEALKKIGEDGAVLIDKRGMIYSPSAYLNVNLASIDEENIDPEFCARHIAALATSASTRSTVYTLSEETGRIREFISGKINKEFPDKELHALLEKINDDIEKGHIKTHKSKKVKKKK